MTVREMLLELKSIVSTNYPPLLVTAALDAMDEFVIGGPTEDNKRSLGFYLGPGDDSPDTLNFKPVLQMQLPGINYDVGTEYFDILNEYLKTIDPSLLKLVSADRISYIEFPPDETNSCIFNFYLEYSKDHDDCS